MYKNRSMLVGITILALVALAFGSELGILPVRSMATKLFALNESLYPSAPAPADAGQAQSTQRLADLNETLYPASMASIAAQPQRNQRLYDLNEIYYPSLSSEPLFWSGRPH